MITYETELIHHGIKGMKWGVRKKYYSPTGGLTKRGNKAINAYKQYNSINKMDAEKKLKYYKKNRRDIKVGAKLRANQGDSTANKMALANSAKKRKIGAGIIAGLAGVRLARTLGAAKVGIKPGILNMGITAALGAGAYGMYKEGQKREDLSKKRPKRPKRQYTKPSSKYRVSITGKDGITDTYTIYGDKKSREAMERRAKKAGATVKYH